MNKIIKTLSLLFLVGSLQAGQAQISSAMQYNVVLPEDSDWGVYQLDNGHFFLPTKTNSQSGCSSCLKSSPPSKQCCAVPGSGGLVNAPTQTGSTTQFQISPCGKIYKKGDSSNRDGVSGCAGVITPTISLGGSISYSGGYTSVEPFMVGGYDTCDSLVPLLYAQLSPFVTADTLQQIITSKCSTIDMSQYWPKDSSGNFQFILQINFVNQSTPLAKEVGDF